MVTQTRPAAGCLLMPVILFVLPPKGNKYTNPIVSILHLTIKRHTQEVFQALHLYGDNETKTSRKGTPKSLANAQTGCLARTNTVYRSFAIWWAGPQLCCCHQGLVSHMVVPLPPAPWPPALLPVACSSGSAELAQSVLTSWFPHKL